MKMESGQTFANDEVYGHRVKGIGEHREDDGLRYSHGSSYFSKRIIQYIRRTHDVRIQRLMANTMSLFMMLFVSSNADRLLPRRTQRATAMRISDTTVVMPNGTAAIN